MNFLITLACVVVCAVLLRKPLAKHPGVFYAIAIALDVLLLASSFFVVPQWLRLPLSVLMRKGGLGVAMFVVVMYIGVFPRGGTLSRWLRPVRAELSILACILVLGHMIVFLGSYLPPLLAGSFPKDHVLAAFAVACLLLALVLVLGITSFRFVKRHMHAHSWKRLQNLAYLFYVLIFVHLFAMLGPAALAGTQPALTNVIVYAVVFGVYVIARIWRAVVDRRDKVDLAETVRDQGFQR